MSLPTYVRRRRIAKPEDYLQQALNAPPQVVHRFLQALKTLARNGLVFDVPFAMILLVMAGLILKRNTIVAIFAVALGCPKLFQS